jgi:hypothetical protein
MGVWRGHANLRPGARLARVGSSLRHPIATVAAGGDRARRLAADRIPSRVPSRGMKPGPMAAVPGVRPEGLAARDWPRYRLGDEGVD